MRDILLPIFGALAILAVASIALAAEPAPPTPPAAADDTMDVVKHIHRDLTAEDTSLIKIQ